MQRHSAGKGWGGLSCHGGLQVHATTLQPAHRQAAAPITANQPVAAIHPKAAAHSLAPVMLAPPSGATSRPLLPRRLPSSRTVPHSLQVSSWFPRQVGTQEASVNGGQSATRLARHPRRAGAAAMKCSDAAAV